MLMHKSRRWGKFGEYYANVLRDIYAGSGKMQECENHADDVQMRQTDKLQWMTPR